MSVTQGGQIVEPGGVYVKPVESGSPSSGSVSPQVPYNDPGAAAATPPATTTTTSTTGNLPPLDWAATFFASLGLPADIAEKINQLFSQYSDVNAASAAALGYIRGTPWYAQTFPGISEGILKGLVSNEAEYRALLNQQSQLYKQYLGRDITGDEFAANLRDGLNLSTIGGRLQGAALVGTYGQDWRYKLGAFDSAPTPDELKALGEESAGLDSPIGQQVKRRLDLATQRFQSIFQGTAAAPGLSVNNGRLTAPGLTGSRAAGDVAA